MRALLTVEFYWPHVGGAEMVVQRVAEGLAAAGHDVHVATSADPARPSRSRGGVTIHEFAVAGNEVKGLRGDVGAYRAFLRDFPCDVLLNYAAQSWTTDVTLQELDRLAARRRVLAPCGYSGLGTPLRRLAYRGYFRRLPDRLRRYDLLIYHSAGFRDYAFGEERRIGPALVIPNGVDVAELDGAPAAGLAADGRPLVINVSNHYRLKRHDRFHRLAARLAPQAAFALLGRTPAGAGWRSCAAACAAAERRGPAQVLDGARERVLAALRAADVLALTSGSEVSPLVLLEAGAARVPWVAFDVGNARELAGGIVVRDERGLEAAVAELLASPALRERLAAAGRAQAEELAWERIAARYDAALRAAVAGAVPAPAA